MARTEDIAVNLVVTAGQQVFDNDWARRMNVSRRDTGSGMTEDEVTDVSERADVAAALGPAEWAGILTTADAARVPDGFQAFAGQPRAFELGTSAILHNALHLGEAVTIRGLAGFAL